MKQVQLTQDVGRRKAGEVLNVNDASAKNLVENRKVAEYFDAEKPAVPVVERSAPSLGNGTVTAIVDPDEPVAPESTLTASDPAATQDTEPHEQDGPALSMSNSKPELEAAAVKAGKVTEEEASALTKAQLLDKLG